jgi:dihydrofolate reductase
MKRLILQQFTTIDGMAADTAGGVDFVNTYSTKHDKSFEDSALEFMDSVDAMLLGRKTYELFVGYWPEASGDDAEFAKKLNSLDKFVVSKTLKSAPWGDWPGASIISKDVFDRIGDLKRGSGKDIVVWGSLSLATSLLKQGLIDEVQLRVVPVALGEGTPLFSDSTGDVEMKLKESQPHDEGMIVLRYQPANA